MLDRSAILTQAHRTARFRMAGQVKAKAKSPKSYRQLLSEALIVCGRLAKAAQSAPAPLPRIDYARRELELVPYIENFEQATAYRVRLEAELHQLTA